MIDLLILAVALAFPVLMVAAQKEAPSGQFWALLVLLMALPACPFILAHAWGAALGALAMAGFILGCVMSCFRLVEAYKISRPIALLLVIMAVIPLLVHPPGRAAFILLIAGPILLERAASSK